MTAFKTILLTTDLSPSSDAAIPYAVSLARQSSGTMHLFHAFEAHASEALAAGVLIGVSASLSAARKQHEDKVNDLGRQIFARYGVKVECITATGHPAQEAVRHAKLVQADAIVIATHGRTGLPHLLMGSIAERIARLSPVPVLTVHPGQTPPASGLAFKTILLTTDFSVNAEAAVPSVLELARQHGSKIVLAHVIEDSVYGASAVAGDGPVIVDAGQWYEQIRSGAKKSLAEAQRKLAARSNMPIETVLGQGRAAEEIINIARDKSADLIAIATHGYTGFSHLLFGSVTERILRTSPIPVLSIHPMEPALKMQAEKKSEFKIPQGAQST